MEKIAHDLELDKKKSVSNSCEDFFICHNIFKFQDPRLFIFENVLSKM